MKEIFGFVVRCPYEVGCSAQNCRYCKVYENHIKRAFESRREDYLLENHFASGL